MENCEQQSTIPAGAARSDAASLQHVQEAPLAQRYQLGLLDLDGVVYRGAMAVEHAASSIQLTQRLGMRIAYTTNNSARLQATVASQLQGFGLDATPQQIITSSVVAARILRHQLAEGARVLVVGGEHLHDEVRKAGFTLVTSVEEKPDAVVQGWYPDIAWHELAQAAYAVEHGAQYYVTNGDMTIPRAQGIAPGCGSLIQAVVEATGVKPLASAGKPERAMYDEARALFGTPEASVTIAQSLAIGDRLDTDIEAANRGGYASLVVLTGVSTPDMLLKAAPILRPTYLSYDLRGLLTPSSSCAYLYKVLVQSLGNPSKLSAAKRSEILNGEAALQCQCGENAASYTQHALSVSADTLDALRAACALAWYLADCVAFAEAPSKRDNNAAQAWLSTVQLPQFTLDALHASQDSEFEQAVDASALLREQVSHASDARA